MSAAGWTFTSFEGALWPLIFILLAGALPTAIWRWAGVLAVGNLQSDSPWLVGVRCISTALIAAVVSQFIFNPSGPLADLPLALRAGSAAFGFGLFLASKNLFLGILAGEVALVSGALWLSGMGQ